MSGVRYGSAVAPAGRALLPTFAPGASPHPLDDPAAAIFTVGQVADLLGVQQAFLRRLDDQQLVRPARSEGRQRRYSRADIERVEQVVALVDEGLTLAGVRRVLELRAEVAALSGELARLHARLDAPLDAPLDDGPSPGAS